MATILHVSSSPRGERSYSRRVAGAFLEAIQDKCPRDKIVELDLFTTELPAIDGAILEAKYNILHGCESTDEQKQAWAEVERVIDQFLAADRLLFSVPMWNFGIPYRLKHYFDVIVQPGYTFSYDPASGFNGLVPKKPVMVVYARGGDYVTAEAAQLDLQSRYLEQILGFIGLSDVRSLVVEPTLAAGPEKANLALEKALAKAREAAQGFC